MHTIIGLFLIAHGLIHTSFVTPKPQDNGGPAWPFDITKSWILKPIGLSTDTIKIIGIVLTIAATLGFVFSGLGWLGVPGLRTIWMITTVFSSISSLLLILLYWNKWFVIGILLDLLFLYLIYINDWKPA
ncbi:MAG: hypothetical protein AB9915_03460 [Candidatus Dojkabacteria bacterium]